MEEVNHKKTMYLYGIDKKIRAFGDYDFKDSHDGAYDPGERR